MKKLGKITLEGASGAKYTFGVYPWDGEFAPGAVGAVYVVTKRREKTGGRHAHARIYAGQTGDLSTRVADHRRLGSFDAHDANCVCVHAEKVESKRVEIESDLVSRFRPPCNQQ